jgi:hypothetical protein
MSASPLVRCGSKAVLPQCPPNVRFAFDSDQIADVTRRRFGANNRHSGRVSIAVIRVNSIAASLRLIGDFVDARLRADVVPGRRTHPLSSSGTPLRFSPTPRRARPLPSACPEPVAARIRAPKPNRPDGPRQYGQRARREAGFHCARDP